MWSDCSQDGEALDTNPLRLEEFFRPTAKPCLKGFASKAPPILTSITPCHRESTSLWYLPKFMCFSPQRCNLCKAVEVSANRVSLHCPYSLNLGWKLFWEIGPCWVIIPKGIFIFWTLNPLGKGKRAKNLWGCLVLAAFWVLWLECDRRIFYVYDRVGVKELWDRVLKGLWLLCVKGAIPSPSIMMKLFAVVNRGRLVFSGCSFLWVFCFSFPAFPQCRRIPYPLLVLFSSFLWKA